MAGSDVVEAMRLALKPFNIQNLADDWAAQAAEKMLITSMSTLQFVTDVESEAWALIFKMNPIFVNVNRRRVCVAPVVHRAKPL